MRLNKLATGCVSAAAVTVLGSTAALAVPLLSYGFNETGTSATNSGIATTSNNNMVNPTGSAFVDYHGAPGSGVSGLATDRAMDLSGEALMGNNGSSTPVLVGGLRVQNPAVQNLQSFTLSGFFKPDTGEVIGNFARLFNFTSGTDGFFLYATANGQLTFSVDNVTTSSTVSYGDAAKWTFFAVTYDGTVNPANAGHTFTSNVKFYEASQGAALISLVSTNTIDALSVNTVAGATTNLFVGSAGGTRTFDGLLDNMQVDGSTTDGTGALTQAQLQVWYTSAIAVPEPTSLAVLGAAAIGALARRRRSI